MSMKLKSIAALAVVLCTAAAQAAPVVTMTLVFDRAFQNTTGGTLAPVENGFGPTDPGYITVAHSAQFRYRFNVFVSLSDPDGGGTATSLAPGSDWQALGFNILLGPGVIPNTGATPYGAAASNYLDLNGDPQTMFNNNADGGTANDLMAMLVTTPSSDIAADRHPGESPRPDPQWAIDGSTDDLLGYPTRIGRVDVLWDGQTLSSIAATQGVGTFLALFVNGSGTPAGNASFVGPPVGIGPIPEPSTIGLLGLGLLGLAARRRRA